MARSMYDSNEITIVNEEYAILHLYDKDNVKIAEALIDIEDAEKIKHIKWANFNCRNTQYCLGGMKRGENYKKVLLHRFVMGVHDDDPKKVQIDHINGNGLDCRKSNLRKATNQQNSFNKDHQCKTRISKYKGVTFIKRSGKWVAKIEISGKSYHLGTFSTEREAAKAYDKAALKHHGEFVCLNIKSETKTQYWKLWKAAHATT